MSLLRFLAAALITCAASVAPAQTSSHARAQHLLSMRAESDTFTLVLPAPGRTERRLMRLAEHAYPLAATIRQALLDALAATGLPQSPTLAHLLKDCGINPDAPIACYVDLSPLQQQAEAAARIASEAQPWWHIGAPPPPAQLARVLLAAHCNDEELFSQRLKPLLESTGWHLQLQDGIAWAANGPSDLQDRTPASSGSLAAPDDDAPILLTRLDLLAALTPQPDLMMQAQGARPALSADAAQPAGDAAATMFGPSPLVTRLDLDENSITLKTTLNLEHHPAYAHGHEKVEQASLAPMLLSAPAYWHWRMDAGRAIAQRLLLPALSDNNLSGLFNALLAHVDEIGVVAREASLVVLMASDELDLLREALNTSGEWSSLPDGVLHWSILGYEVYVHTLQGALAFALSPCPPAFPTVATVTTDTTNAPTTYWSFHFQGDELLRLATALAQDAPLPEAAASVLRSIAALDGSKFLDGNHHVVTLSLELQ